MFAKYLNEINNIAYKLLVDIWEKRTGVPNALISGSLYGLGPRESDNNGETPAGVHILCKRLEVRFA